LSESVGGFNCEGIKVLACACGGGIERVWKLFFFHAGNKSDGCSNRHMECGLRSWFDDAKHNADN